MSELLKAKEQFTFYTRFNLSELTGLKAHNIEELLALLKEVPGSSIYHHTHRFLQQHEYLSPEPPNDFAYWISYALGEDELAEKLASIDIVQFGTIRGLRDRIIAVIEEYRNKCPSCSLRFASAGKEFYFNKSISFVVPTAYTANDLSEFKTALEKVSNNSIYFHMFEARLRLERESNDFSNWIESSIGDAELAKEIAKLDPYTYALDDLRKIIIKIVYRRIT
ncbi:MAG: DUF5752 family protein [Elusimicrobia bacterium]|nr:DUF5752 family protein [Candidatus Liberimonas magnetica]